MAKYSLIFMLILPLAFTCRAQVLKSDTVDILNYGLHLDIVHLSTKSISGYAELTIVPLIDSLSSFSLDLLRLEVDSVQCDGLTGQYIYDDTTLTVFPQYRLLLNDTSTLVIWYHGQPVLESYGWGGFHFSNDSSMAFNLGIAFYDDPHNYGRVWFPCIDEFVERATFEYFIRVKDPFMAVCSGMLIGVQHNNDNTTTYHWRLDRSIPAYLASVAISKYAKASIPINAIQGQISADIYVKPQDSLAALASFQHLPQMVQIFEDRFGPYLWPRIGFVSTSQGAMEHACNIAVSSYMFNGTTSYEWLYAHELSHHWFGDLVTCASAADMWLNEGWAVFCESIFMEGFYGAKAFRDYARGNHEKVLQFAHTGQGDGSYLPLYGIPHQYTYGATVYDKGSSVVHSLRGYLGDSLFFNGMKAYLAQYAWSDASTFDLRNFLTSYTGINMNPWFEAWVFTPGFIDFRIDSFHVVSSAVPESQVTVFMGQKLRGPAQYAGNHRVELLFMDDNWNKYSAPAYFEGISDSVQFLVPFEPTMVIIDPEERILDATTDNYQVIKQIGSTEFLNTKFILNVLQIQDSAFVRVTHHWVAPDPFPSPIPGLTLSTQRYWTIEGIFPPGFDAEGRFLYSKANYLDDDIITNTFDSLIILYRPGPGNSWSPVNFVRSGSAYNGRIIVPNLKPGDYALAVWDQVFLGFDDAQPSNNGIQSIQISPNPSNDTFTIIAPETGYLSIIDANGLLIEKVWVIADQQFRWSAEGLKSGTYFAILNDADGRLLARSKMLLIRP